MTAAIASLFLLLWPPAPQPAPGVGQVRFIQERGAKVSVNDGVFEVRSGRGWLRVPGVHLNFRLTFEYSGTADTDAGVVIRTWTGEDGWPGTGYRLRLPMQASVDPTRLLTAKRQRASSIRGGRLDLRPVDDWQRVEISADGREISLTINDALVGVYEVERYGGYVLFDTREGRTRLRRIRITSTERASDLPAEVMPADELGKRGGQMPTVLRAPEPPNLYEVMKHSSLGAVGLDAVVLPDGSVGPVTITQSVDPDLDLVAVAIVREWRFRPAVYDGKAVAALVTVEIMFAIR